MYPINLESHELCSIDKFIAWVQDSMTDQEYIDYLREKNKERQQHTTVALNKSIV